MTRRSAATWWSLVVIGMAPAGIGISFLMYWYLLANIAMVAMIAVAFWALAGGIMLGVAWSERRARVRRVALPRAVASYGVER